MLKVDIVLCIVAELKLQFRLHLKNLYHQFVATCLKKEMRLLLSEERQTMAYQKNSLFRFCVPDNIIPYISDYENDYFRVLHSPSFRRLEHKTQLFPGNESDFFRNRLTHSLEVARISKMIAQKIKNENENTNIEVEVCEIAGLIHDLGHPPFGHNGEEALDRCMRGSGGFEGNAQTLRIITKLEKQEKPKQLFTPQKGKDKRCGLNLTARVIASAIKYDNVIERNREDKNDVEKGYYESERDIVEIIKECITKSAVVEEDESRFKTIECSIMDLADDIAYSTYDLEDAFKAGFLTPYDMMAIDGALEEQIMEKLPHKIASEEFRYIVASIFPAVWKVELSEIKAIENADKFYDDKALSKILTSYRASKEFASDGYLRTGFTTFIANQLIDGIEYEHNDDNPILSKVKFNSETEILVSILKNFSFITLINSPMIKVSESRGQEIITKLFNKLEENAEKLLPADFRYIYNNLKNRDDKKRLVCDFIAGMTDRYALEFYGRLFSENPQTIFKPL